MKLLHKILFRMQHYTGSGLECQKNIFVNVNCDCSLHVYSWYFLFFSVRLCNFNLFIWDFFFNLSLNNSNKKINLILYTWAKKNSIAFWSLIHKGGKTPAVGESLFSTGDIYNKSFKIWLSISKRESQCHSFDKTETIGGYRGKNKPWYAIYYSNTCMRKKFDQCLSAPYRRKHLFPVW